MIQLFVHHCDEELFRFGPKLISDKLTSLTNRDFHVIVTMKTSEAIIQSVVVTQSSYSPLRVWAHNLLESTGLVFQLDIILIMITCTKVID